MPANITLENTVHETMLKLMFYSKMLRLNKRHLQSQQSCYFSGYR